MFDVSKVCRICLREEYPKLPIFTEDDEKSESKPTLPEKIMSFAQVKVVKDDGLPMYICVKCYCQVDTTVEFKRLCEESFNYFKRQPHRISNIKAIPPSLQNDKENFDGEQRNLPEDCIKVNECELQYGLAEEEAEEAAIQVFRVMGCDESWIDSNETDFEASLIKCETSLDYPDIEIDLSNVKIENVCDNWPDEELVSPLEINSEDLRVSKTQNFDGLIPMSNTGKNCKCRICDIVFSNRQEMAFHKSFVHRRCSMCAKYFYSNKDKNEHVCNSVTEPRTDKVYRFCHLCNTTVDQIESHIAWHSENTTKVPEANEDTNTETDSGFVQNAKCEMTRAKIKCSLCDVVCLDERGLRVHLKFMHTGHRIIYSCSKCKSRRFFTKVSCIKHLTEKHGITGSENIKFELEQVNSNANANANAKGMQQRKLKKNRWKCKKKVNPKTECHEQIKGNNLKKKVSERKKCKENKMESRVRKNLVQYHPPFSHTSPIVGTNFSIILVDQNVKHYVCRGCGLVCKNYIAAYNHYYNYNKRQGCLKNRMTPWWMVNRSTVNPPD